MNSNKNKPHEYYNKYKGMYYKHREADDLVGVPTWIVEDGNKFAATYNANTYTAIEAIELALKQRDTDETLQNNIVKD